MSLGLQESRNRRRRQRRWAIIKWLLILAGLVAAGVFAYETGSQLARIEVARLEEKVADLESQLEAAKQQQQDLRSQLRETQQNLEQWKQRYRAEVPSGKPAEILGLIKERMDTGVSADRLAFVVSKAKEQRECTGGPTTKRFIVQTPLSTGAAQSVSFANATITVTAKGQSATDAQGRPEAWFDPDKPLTVTFTRIGGETSTAEGTLPLHHSIVAGDSEHRFTVVDAEQRAFVEVTWERCAYP